jgi:DNA-binding CsgD family transcriptional regulator
MNRSRPRARITIRAQDPELRAQIAERLSGLADISVEFEENGAAGGNGTPPADAVVETPAAGLTPRELEVLQLLADGLANKEIAARLGFSTHTAKFHVESLLRKLDAVNRAEAVREGIRWGFIGL